MRDIPQRRIAPQTMSSTQQSTPGSGTPADHAIKPIDSASFNLPNLITFSRIALSFALFTVIYIQGYWLTATAIFLIAASTDALDGYIARKYGLVTTLGRILDPFADKIIVGGAFIFLVNRKDVYLGVEYTSGVSEWMALIVIGREMFITSLRGFLEQHGRDFSATWSGKIKMVLQCMAITVSLLSLSYRTYEMVDRVFFEQLRFVVLWAAIAVTVYSGVAYTYRAILMLRPDSDG